MYFESTLLDKPFVDINNGAVFLKDLAVVKFDSNETAKTDDNGIENFISLIINIDIKLNHRLAKLTNLIEKEK